jgi:hypothetical protein
MSSKYKADLEKYIRLQLNSPERESYKKIMAQLEDIVADYNKSDDRLNVLISKMAKTMHKHRNQELPFADMMTVVGMNIRDFKEYPAKDRMDKVIDKFVDLVNKQKHRSHIEKMEREAMQYGKDLEFKDVPEDAFQKMKDRFDQNKAARLAGKPISSSASRSVSQKKKSPSVKKVKKRIVPTYIDPSVPSKVSSPFKIRSERSPSQKRRNPSAIKARVISGQALPAIELLRALNVPQREAMVAKVLKSRSNRRKSPSSSRRAHRKRSDSARRKCPPGKSYHSPSRRCRKVKKMTCKQLRAWYETHHK